MYAGLWQVYDHSLYEHAKLTVDALDSRESRAMVNDPFLPGAVCTCSCFLVGRHTLKGIAEGWYGKRVLAYVACPVVSFHEEGVLDCVDHCVHPFYLWVLGQSLRRRCRLSVDWRSLQRVVVERCGRLLLRVGGRGGPMVTHYSIASPAHAVRQVVLLSPRKQ